MIRHLFNITVLSLCLAISAFTMEVDDFGIGEEYIQPLRYPKFSLSFDYGMTRRFHGVDNSKLRAKLPNNLAASISFESGLYQYFNAGALFSLNFPTKEDNLEPVHLRFTLFAKPYIPITNRISIFSRLGTGLSVSFFNYHLVYTQKDDDRFSDFRQELENTYLSQGYAFFPFGANAMATIGVEAFPFERVGLGLEWGFRGDFFYAAKDETIRKFAKQKAETGAVPNSLKYFVYEMPLMLTLHIIL